MGSWQSRAGRVAARMGSSLHLVFEPPLGSLKKAGWGSRHRMLPEEWGRVGGSGKISDRKMEGMDWLLSSP